jgi:TRAP-type mannitol/chloroaromatic compound transport system permease small subunit
MQRFLFVIDHISIWSGKLFAWAAVLLTGVVCYEVFMRYAIGAPSGWAYDMGYILYGALFIMAGAYALATQSHVRADVLYRLLPVRVQGGIDLVLYLVFFLPAVAALMYAGYHFAEMSWRIGERSPYSPVGPPLYHFKALIPISGFFLALQGIAELIRSAIALGTGKWPPRVHDVRDIGEALIESTLSAQANKETVR